MSSSPPPVVLYSTTTPALAKVKADIARIKRILDNKRVSYEEVDLASTPGRRAEMLAGSDDLKTIPQLHVNGRLVGDADTIQELEDFAELDAFLPLQPAAHQPFSLHHAGPPGPHA